MAKNPIVIKQNFKIGELDAESDTLLLESCFIDNGYYNRLIDVKDTASIIVGRTGAGKSALLYKISSSVEKYKKLDPNDISIKFLEHSDIIKFFDGINVHLDMFYKVLWRHILIMELLKIRHGIKNESETNNFFSSLTNSFRKDEVKKKAIEYFREWGDKFWINTDTHLKEITNKLERDVKASFGGKLHGIGFNAEGAQKLSEEEKTEVRKRATEVVNNLQIQKLNEILDLLSETSFNDSQKKYYIIIDQLDEDWAESKTRYKFIRALIEEIKVFRRINNIKIIVALRKDLLNSVFNSTRGSGFQEEKYESYILDIKWTADQLTELVKKRVSEVYKKQYTKDDVTIEDIFPTPKGGKRGMLPLDYIIERTLYRPRDILQFVNEAFNIAYNRERISWSSIHQAEAIYSTKRLRSLKEEWSDIYPSFEQTVEILRNLPVRFTRGSISQATLDHITSELSIEDTNDSCAIIAKQVLNSQARPSDVLNEILMCLYTLSVIGFKISSTEKYKWSFINSVPVSKNEIKRANDIKIHKMLHKALDIRINQNEIYLYENEEEEEDD